MCERMFVYSRATVRRVRTLIVAGIPAGEIARTEAVSISTLKRWRSDWAAALGRDPGILPRNGREILTEAQEPDYAYLLGLYLGDGHIASMSRGVYRLYLTMDSRYHGIIAEAREVLQRVMPNNKIGLRRKPYAAAVDVSCYSRLWPILLPQHGPGRKHEREILLQDWQVEITHRNAGRLVRGLIHSDGCRYVARQRVGRRVYEYERYGFTNRSSDILRICCDHLDLLGVHWTLNWPYDIQIARRGAVERLDLFVGPKT
jgi:hypothetical protein